MGPPLVNSVGDNLRFIYNHANMLLLLVLAVPILGVACLLLLRSPRTRMRLQLGPRRPSHHARSLPTTPATRAMEIKRDTHSLPETSPPQHVPPTNAVADAIASQWDAESTYTRQAYLESSVEGVDPHDRECTTSSPSHAPTTPSTASSFSTVYSVDYGPSPALVVVDGVLVNLPNESGSTVRVTELNSPIMPLNAEFFDAQETEDGAQLDDESLDPVLWSALFDGIEPESP